MTDEATSALFGAIGSGDLDALAAAARDGADFEAADGGGRTPLVAAVTAGDVRIVSSLLALGADPNHRVDESSPLVLAAKVHAPHLYDLFSEAGKRPATEPPEPCIRALVKGGADLARDLWTAASMAISNRAFTTLEALDDAGADWHQPCATAEMAAPVPLANLLLLQAADHAWPSLAILRFLLSKGASPDASLSGAPPIVHLARHREMELDCLAVLVDAQAAIDAPDARGATALMYSAGFGHVEAFLYLLDHGADPARADLAGRTPIDWAASTSQQALLRAAAARGLDRQWPPDRPHGANDGGSSLLTEGAWIVLQPGAAVGTFTPTDAARDFQGAVAAIIARWGWSRARIGPFPVVRVLSHRVREVWPNNPWVSAAPFDLRIGDLMVLAVSGVRLGDDVLKDAPATFLPLPIVTAVATVPAANPEDADAYLAAQRGRAITACLESVVTCEDGYETVWSGLRASDAGLVPTGSRLP